MALPSGYKRLLYIRANGGQYIKTNFKPNQSTKVTVTYRSTDAAAGVVAADDGWLKKGFGIFTHTLEYGSAQSSYSPVDRERTVTIDQGKIIIDGTQVATRSQTFQTTSALVICALNRNGTINEYMTGDIYSCQVSDNGTLDQDYIPCETPSGEVGLYDDINQIFCGNAGTGAFTAGPVVGPDGSRTLIDAVDYQIKNGKGMLSSVVYGNYSGKVMVNGVVYDILLDTPGYLITITGNGKNGSKRYAEVAIDGIIYTDPGEITIPAGKTITLSTRSTSAGDIMNAAIYLNGEAVAYHDDYDYTPSGDITVELIVDTTYPTTPYGKIFITTD